MDDLYKKLKTFGKVKLNEPMSKHTTFKIGGLVRYFIIVNNNDNLVKLLNYLSDEGVDYYILGGGSNILFKDDDFDGVVIKVNSSEFRVQSAGVIEVDSGVSLGVVMSEAMKNGLTGLEWSAGIPGTVGGAVRGNAGAFGQATADVIEKVEVWQDGEVVEFSKEECNFIYRGSIFKENKDLVILRVWFKLKLGDKQKIVSKVQEIIQSRKGKYPIYPSAGCFFSNVEIAKWPGDKTKLPPIFIERGKVPVGWIIEQLGYKGKEYNGVQVGESHCNFIVNKKQATQSDVLKLVEEIKEKVYNKYRVDLEEEVEIF